MKNILLGTSVLVGAAALLAGAANADTPKVTLGGNADFQLGVVGEDNDTGLRSGAFRSEHDVNVNVDGKTDAGLGYGAALNLVASGTYGADTDNFQAPRNYVYLDGAWGRVQGGSDLGVTNTMKVDASKIARASGGIDGDFTYFMSTPTGAAFIATPDLVLDYGTYGTTNSFGNESTKTNNKISYYTPRFAGIQAGVSYLFDSSANDRGNTVTRTKTAGEAGNVLLGAINYEGKFSDVGVKLGATGEHGNAQGNTVEDLRTWQLGGEVSYMGFSVAGSYADLGDSLRTKGAGLNDNTFWTLGASYETGPFGVSVTYLKSNYEVSSVQDNEFRNISVGADYKLAPGLTPYAEVSFIEADGAGTAAATNNDATVFIAGTSLSF